MSSAAGGFQQCLNVEITTEPHRSPAIQGSLAKTYSNDVYKSVSYKQSVDSSSYNNVAAAFWNQPNVGYGDGLEAGLQWPSGTMRSN